MELAIHNVVFNISFSDFSPYKPLYIEIDYLGDYNFFFSTGDAKYGCYLAPERFVTSLKDQDKISKEPDISIERKMAMDIFSLGCVIAEIFLGHALFELPKMQAYKRGDIDCNTLLSSIDNLNIRELIGDMIQLDETKRKKIDYYLNAWCEKVFPKSFTLLFYYFIGTLLHHTMSSSDKRVAHIYKYLDVIWNVCFFSKSAPKIVTGINHVLFERLRDDALNVMVKSYMKPTTFHFCLEGDSSTRNVKWEYINKASTQEDKELNRGSVVIIMQILGNALQYSYYPSTKICALSMLRKMGMELRSSSVILQYVLPFHIFCLKDENTSVAVEAAEGGIELLDFLDPKVELHSTEFKLFPRYIFKEYQDFSGHNELYAKACFSKIIGKIASHGKKLIELGMIYHTKYLREFASREVGKKADTQTSIVGSLPSIRAGYQNELQETFTVLMNFYESKIKKDEVILYTELPNHLHELATLGGTQNSSAILNLIDTLSEVKRIQPLVPLLSLNHREILSASYPVYVWYWEEMQ